MNERIKELAEQAREYATTRHPVSNIILSVNLDLFEQKLAELIVKECARVASNQVMDVEGNDWGVRHAVEKHFGVEE